MTHADLVKRARLWLAGSKRCRVVLTEMVCGNITEIPDAIGWGPRGSILVECKASRADFRADAKKWFRLRPEYGLGERRYFMAPAGMINPEEVEGGWGLLEVHPHQVRCGKKAEPFPFEGATARNERQALISATWRVLEVAKLLKPVDGYEVETTESERG